MSFIRIVAEAKKKAIVLILDPWQPSIEPELMIWRSA
jgi:hypothetical protein